MYNNLKNSVTLIGHLGKDPETREYAQGKKVTRFTLATNDYYKNNEGERMQRTQWHNCVAFGKSAELITTLLRKGKKIALQGKLEYRDYEDKDGNKRKLSEIIINEFHLLDKLEESIKEEPIAA